jgi:phosphoribosylcarboxyaminoimidazole (NCAIR) mutase
VPGTIKQVASSAKRPAVAVGAAAAGLAGGLVLRSRTRRKTVLGVPVPSGLGKTLSGIDPKSVAKTVGQASKKIAKTTKSVSKDLERAGDQAERIGKILD